MAKDTSSSKAAVRRVIYIMRHAKAEAADGHDDYLRRLVPRGVADAREIATTMALARLDVERIISSEAPRAAETAEIVGDWLGVPQRRREFKRKLYEAGRAEWLEELRALPASCTSVLLVGHSPVLEELVRHLGQRAVKLPRGGALALAHTGDWSKVGRRTAEWHWGYYPRRASGRLPRLPFAVQDAGMVPGKGMVQPQNRELSWLSFNARVAQEAADKTHNLITRLRFVGIVSSNLDEFYRVRMGALVSGARARDKRKMRAVQELSSAVMERVGTMQAATQRELEHILAELKRKHDVELVDETQLTAQQRREAQKFFEENVRSLLPVVLQPGREAPAKFLNTERAYLAVRLADARGKYSTAVVELPTARVQRFVSLPIVDEKTGAARMRYLWLDDLLRLCLPDYFRSFGYEMHSAHCFKVSRNAELSVGDADGKGDGWLADVAKVRNSNAIVRLLHDAEMPAEVLTYLQRRLPLARGVTIVAGGRYHNHRDFINFPLLEGVLSPVKLRPLPVADFAKGGRYFRAVERRDMLLHFPFHEFRHLVGLLREASLDESVHHISMTIYRLAPRSEVVDALLNAIHNGKKVTVMLETKARFDEEENIHWMRVLGDAGAEVLPPRETEKVHAKACLIERRKQPDIAFFSTGNFNEATAKNYCDTALLTADPRLTKEAAAFFQLLRGKKASPGKFRHLLVSPITLRGQLVELIHKEISNAQAGKDAEVCLKLNSLNDPGMVLLLHRAAVAGVRVKLIVRGIFSLNPELPEYEGRMHAVSVVDRLLEHARYLTFANGGKPLVYIASADFLTRNLDHRYELAVPVYNLALRRQIISLMQLQLSDNTKARVLNAAQDNTLQGGGGKRVRAQRATPQLLQKENKKKGD